MEISRLVWTGLRRVTIHHPEEVLRPVATRRHVDLQGLILGLTQINSVIFLLYMIRSPLFPGDDDDAMMLLLLIHVCTDRASLWCVRVYVCVVRAANSVSHVGGVQIRG